MKIGSLFSGIGGLDLGLEWAGHELSWLCESDKACRQILARHYSIPLLPDVRELDDGTPRVDLLCGGFPCQDLSHAGRQDGLAGDRSGLWFAYARAIRLLRPRFVLIENVTGLAATMGGRAGESALGTVIADLAESGYVGSWFRLRASDIGAPHRRERIFIVATDSTGDGGREIASGAPAHEEASARRSEAHDYQPERARQGELRAADGLVADPERLRRQRNAETDRGVGRSVLSTLGDQPATNSERLGRDWGGGRDAQSASGARSDGRSATERPGAASTDADDDGWQGSAQPGLNQAGGHEASRRDDAPGRVFVSGDGSAAEPRSSRREGPSASGFEARRDGLAFGSPGSWGRYESAVARWERILERAAPDPTDERKRLSPVFVEWMMGLPEGWTEGPARTIRLKVLGNAVVPQVAQLIGENLPSSASIQMRES